MGELAVLTASRRVAAWAAQGVQVQSKHGTILSLKPIVLLITADNVESLLDPHCPELGLFAAWSVHGRHGPAAWAIVKRAIDLARSLPGRLRKSQVRATWNVLSERMLLLAERYLMDLSKMPESRPFRRFRLRMEAAGEIRGKQEALLTILGARGLRISPAQRSRITECSDVARLGQWIARAVTATSTTQVLSTPSEPRRRARAA